MVKFFMKEEREWKRKNNQKTMTFTGRERTMKKEFNKHSLKMSDLTQEERNRLVGAFAWLIKEDRKQHPELYKKLNKKSSYSELE